MVKLISGLVAFVIFILSVLFCNSLFSARGANILSGLVLVACGFLGFYSYEKIEDKIERFLFERWDKKRARVGPSRTILIFFFVLFIAPGSDSLAQVYKYTDEKGMVHFTDTPTDRKFINPNAPPPPDSRSSRFKDLIDRVMNETENRERPAANKRICLSAVEILRGAMKKPPSTKDGEFLDTVERAIFNRRISVAPITKREFPVYNDEESSMLLKKAKIVLGMGETLNDRRERQDRRIKSLEERVDWLD